MADQKHSSSSSKGGHEKETHTQSKASHPSESHPGAGKEKDAGNFANDHEKAVEAGRKGGQHSHDKS